MDKDDVWDKLNELGLEDDAMKLIETATDETINMGYDAYLIDSVFVALSEGMEKAGIDNSVELYGAHMIAQSYLIGYLLGKAVLKSNDKYYLRKDNKSCGKS